MRLFSNRCLFRARRCCCLFIIIYFFHFGYFARQYIKNGFLAKRSLVYAAHRIGMIFTGGPSSLLFDKVHTLQQLISITLSHCYHIICDILYTHV